MLLLSLLLIPMLGIFSIIITMDLKLSSINFKYLGLIASILNALLASIIFILFDFTTNQFQFVQEHYEISYFDFYLGVDGLSIYFVLLTTLIIPISLLSNWNSIKDDVQLYIISLLLLETLLLAVFLVLDILLFYIFFESILPPLFLLIGVFGADNRVKASFYLFLYTLFGSLFLLLSILSIASITGGTDFDTLFKGNYFYVTQLFIFYGIFIAFAVKTPTIFLNTWLLKAHVESPLGGSIILAAIVLKLSLYGILRLILPVLPKAYTEYTFIIFVIGVITIVFASLSTLRTIDIKELIAYSSVSHAAVYLLGVFSNNIQGVEGSINLGLAHGFVSPGLFICAGGVLYDRFHTRIVAIYKGTAQLMPLFAVIFFILCLGNCGSPLTLNFIGEFLSLYGVFERSSIFGLFASTSIIFSAAYTIYMYQRISFGGSYSRMFIVNIVDLSLREFMLLLTLVVPTVIFGIYPAPILDGLHYSVSTLMFTFENSLISCDGPSIRLSLETSSNYVFYHNLFAALLWAVIFAITIKYYSYIKWYFTEHEVGTVLWAMSKSIPFSIWLMIGTNVANLLLLILLGWYDILSISLSELYNLLLSVDIIEVCNSLYYNYDLAETHEHSASLEFNPKVSYYNVFLASSGNEDVTMGGTEDVSMGSVDTPRSNTPTPSSDGKSEEYNRTHLSNTSTPFRKTHTITRPDSHLSIFYWVLVQVASDVPQCEPITDVLANEVPKNKIITVEEWQKLNCWQKLVYFEGLPSDELKASFREHTTERELAAMRMYTNYLNHGTGVTPTGQIVWPEVLNRPEFPKLESPKPETAPLTNVGDGRDQYPWRMKRPQYLSEFDTSYTRGQYNPNRIWGLLGVDPVPMGESNLMDCGQRDHNPHEWMIKEVHAPHLNKNPELIDHGCAKCDTDLREKKTYHKCDFCGNHLCTNCKLTITGQYTWRFGR